MVTKAEELEREVMGPFNERGCRITVIDPGNPRGFEIGMIDSWRILRVATHDGGGDGMIVFWVLYRNVGWWRNPQQQYTHVAKVLSWERTLDGMLLHTDQNGRTLELDLLWADEDLATWKRIVAGRTDEWTRMHKEQAAYIRDEYLPRWWNLRRGAR